MPWVVPLASAVISAGGALASNIMTNKANRRNIELANQQNVQLWNMQNEYNSPVNQMKRYREAGLNPYLVNSSNAGLAGSAPQMQASQSSYSNFVSPAVDTAVNVANMLQGLEFRDKQIENLQHQIDYTDAKIATEKERLQDWRFRNIFGLGNYDTKNCILNLQMSNLYNKYRLDWNVDSPWIDTLGDDINNTVLVPTRKAMLKGLYSKMADSSLSYQHAGTSLRNIQAQWQFEQNKYGLGSNVPWYVSLIRKALDQGLSYYKRY